ncbi:chemotaxis protein [Philodulcilactobacillus myokoensis]|uniref:Chemotaxis protein n=1 Tax=Philodulcilactobacillus myokoensis TaxID=2929573 RepID=A0A9W6B1C7_9LACO|nr:DUF948 domain-containing protein [Philodulcilactobacillus myokoensis]GLB46695.1 chemotaxis protein [Philodulcilactobacillus myokoensis]
MTGGEIAALIAAIAFLLLVFFIGIFLTRLMNTLNEVNRSIKSLTDDVDVVSKQSSDILATSNDLLKDVNEKINTIDPVFNAAADLGQSVTDLNNSVRHMTTRVKDNTNRGAKFALISKMGTMFYKMHNKKKRK